MSARGLIHLLNDVETRAKRRRPSPAVRTPPRTPLLMTRSEALPLKEASRRTGLSTDTLRRLHAEHGIGRQLAPRSPIEVSLPAVLMLQHADHEALELLREGRRDDERVARYLRLMDE